jgi:ABC-type transport system involved in multi-copper enzyme maturation permease subunit
MLTNIRYIFLTALRDNLFWVLLLGVLAAAIIAHMLGSTAPIDTRQLTISYSSSAARVMIIIGLIVFVCSHLSNAFATHEIDVFLSRPITRSNLVISYWVGFANVALLHVLATVALVALQGVMSWSGYFFWTLSLLLECWLAVALALFASFTLKSGVASVLTSLGLYALSRMIGFFIATTNSAFLFEQRWVNLLLTYALKGIAIIMPRLDFFTKSEWLVDGLKHSRELELFAAQAAIFIPLLLLATIADFRRKQF